MLAGVNIVDGWEKERLARSRLRIDQRAIDLSSRSGGEAFFR